MTTIGEHGFHTLEVTSQSDALQGQTLTVYYVSPLGDEVIEGASATGVEEGVTMDFVTDLENTGVSPGQWTVQLVREDGSVVRQVGLEGERDNELSITVTDADSIQ